MPTLGTKLDRLIGAKGLRNEDVAAAIRARTGGRGAASKATVSRWRCDQGPPPRADQLLALARILGCSVDYLADNGLEADPAPLRATAAEERLLWVARRVGVEAALDRLLGVPPPPAGAGSSPS